MGGFSLPTAVHRARPRAGLGWSFEPGEIASRVPPSMSARFFDAALSILIYSNTSMQYPGRSILAAEL